MLPRPTPSHPGGTSFGAGLPTCRPPDRRSPALVRGVAVGPSSPDPGPATIEGHSANPGLDPGDLRSPNRRDPETRAEQSWRSPKGSCSGMGGESSRVVYPRLRGQWACSQSLGPPIVGADHAPVPLEAPADDLSKAFLADSFKDPAEGSVQSIPILCYPVPCLSLSHCSFPGKDHIESLAKSR
jgi:hypothetical protein